MLRRGCCVMMEQQHVDRKFVGKALAAPTPRSADACVRACVRATRTGETTAQWKCSSLELESSLVLDDLGEDECSRGRNLKKVGTGGWEPG